MIYGIVAGSKDDAEHFAEENGIAWGTWFHIVNKNDILKKPSDILFVLNGWDDKHCMLIKGGWKFTMMRYSSKGEIIYAHKDEII